MEKFGIPDPFEGEREAKGFGTVQDQEDDVMMLLRLKDVRKTAKDVKTFQSGAKPGRIVVPSEVSIRDTRQIPFEVDPPLHGKYRSVLEDWFRRPENTDYQQAIAAIIRELLSEVKAKSSVEAVSEFSLKLQSRALTLLLNIPYAEAETWISWGTHVFRSEDSAVDGDKAEILYSYIDRQILKAEESPGEDLYSILLNSEIDGRKFTKEEVRGVMILTFAGGRDTVINAVTNTLAYIASKPQVLPAVKANPAIITTAVEELVRYFSPLTHMGRVVTADTEICEHAVKADSRVSLCWASANRDPNTFENPNEINLERQLNPHVGFGFGIHKCLGATHARQVLRTLLQVLAEDDIKISLLEAKENIEDWGEFQRKVGYDQIHLSFS
ncbi:cytochrome P-450 like protein [Echinicola pacifica]|uniref:Cytochrome P-450 like protein n=1 Tax=Echinicola pacifica TaxID=346377 RepID=A0A918PX43_9BACT|nr:cytochrome P450 [Echinicola pacifica]GGZ24834.1 cytochrome P-450 like protein [Echinicola pacifica]